MAQLPGQAESQAYGVGPVARPASGANTARPLADGVLPGQAESLTYGRPAARRSDFRKAAGSETLSITW